MLFVSIKFIVPEIVDVLPLPVKASVRCRLLLLPSPVIVKVPITVSVAPANDKFIVLAEPVLCKVTFALDPTIILLKVGGVTSTVTVNVAAEAGENTTVSPTKGTPAGNPDQLAALFQLLLPDPPLAFHVLVAAFA